MCVQMKREFAQAQEWERQKYIVKEKKLEAERAKLVGW